VKKKNFAIDILEMDHSIASHISGAKKIKKKH